MTNTREYVAYYLELLNQGDYEDGFFGLIEAEPAAVRLLIDAFSQPKYKGIRADIIKCIWQHRDPETIEFLTVALRDPEPHIWKQALDGIVAIGGRRAIDALEQARANLATDKLEWVQEAIDQIQHR